MIIIDKIGKYLAPGRSWYTRNVNTIKKISVHHDAIPHDNRSAEEVMQSIMNIHNKTNGWPGASYHYYIHRDGKVYQMNKHEWVTWIDGINWDAIGIVVNGYFHPPHNNEPTKPEIVALKELLDELGTKHPEFPAGKGDVYAHRERASTACPGDKAYPYVKEYREKKGDVSWGKPDPVTPPTNPTNPSIPNDDFYRIFHKGTQIVALQENPIPKLEGYNQAIEDKKKAEEDRDNARNEKRDLEDKINKAKQALG